jgi:hypothetical protein
MAVRQIALFENNPYHGHRSWQRAIEGQIRAPVVTLKIRNRCNKTGSGSRPAAHLRHAAS